MKDFFKNKTNLAIIIGAVIISLGIISYALINKYGNKTNNIAGVLNADKIFTGKDFKDNEYILGNTKNKITVLVYSDFECPFCKMLQENTIQVLQKEYSLDPYNYANAKIGIVYRHFAQTYHDKAPNEINTSLCERELYGQDAYINFINRIYFVTPANNGLDQSLLPDIGQYAYEKAKEGKLLVKKDFNKEELLSCAKAKKYESEFQADAQDAIDSGLDGTPYTLILYRDGNDNITITKVSGAKDVSYFEKIINRLLEVK